ncbi:MAG: hypothetical protein BroJett003_22470 [Planctomycetota bacterium]|nr:MAG: hypothetical protein BroJett003_22470 [Planctomycetota bacterium]
MPFSQAAHRSVEELTISLGDDGFFGEIRVPVRRAPFQRADQRESRAEYVFHHRTNPAHRRAARADGLISRGAPDDYNEASAATERETDMRKAALDIRREP